MIKLNDIVVKFGDFTALHDINVHVKEHRGQKHRHRVPELRAVPHDDGL